MTPPDPNAAPSAGPSATADAMHAYFERYSDAFEAFDAEGIADHYTMPCLFVRGGQTDACTSPEALRESIESLLALHKTWDVRRAKLKGVEVVEAAPLHLVVRADWRLGRKGRIRWAYSTTYILVPDDSGWRIASALTHDAPF